MDSALNLGNMKWRVKMENSLTHKLHHMGGIVCSWNRTPIKHKDQLITLWVKQPVLTYSLPSSTFFPSNWPAKSVSWYSLNFHLLLTMNRSYLLTMNPASSNCHPQMSLFPVTPKVGQPYPREVSILGAISTFWKPSRQANWWLQHFHSAQSQWWNAKRWRSYWSIFVLH